MFDYILRGFEYSEVPVDTLIAEENEKFPLQRIFPFSVCVIISVVAGILMSVWYYAGITIEKKMFIFVPRFFAVSPLTSVIDPILYDALQTSIMVSTIEELVFVGIFFMVVWNILRFALTHLLKTDNIAIGIFTLLVAAVLVGSVASFAFHSFLPHYTAYHFEDAARHFTMTSIISGSTGVLFGGIIAHASHNFFAKTSLRWGSYEEVSKSFRAFTPELFEELMVPIPAAPP